MTGDFEKLAYQEAVRGLDKQETLLEALRTRTGVLLASSFLAASFLGQEAFRNPGPQGLAIAAAVALVITVGAGVYILLPKRTRVSPVAAAESYAGLHGLQSDMAEIYRQLAYNIDRLWDSNEQEMRCLSRTFVLSAALLVNEIVIRIIFVG